MTAAASSTARDPAERLRIAYLSGSPRISTRDDAVVVPGPRAHVLGLINALRAGGHVVDEYVLGDRVRSDVRAVNVPVAAGSRQSRSRLLAVDVVRLVTRVPIAWRGRRVLPGRYDIAYERFALFQQLGHRFRRGGAAWVVETNAVLSQEARHERSALALQRIAGWLERRTYRRADLVVCVSESLRGLLVEELGIPADRVVVIPNAVDPERFHPDQPAALPPPPGELVIGYVGVVYERQGLDDLIEVVAQLRGEGVPAEVSIVGEGPARAGLEQLAHERGVADVVRFHGSAQWTEIPAHIASFTVAYSGQRGVGGMPMYHSPLKIYEYLAVGKPVVASHHADAEQTLIEPGAGWTFPPGDRAALLELLRAAASMDPAELSSVGQRGRAQVVAHHTWAHRVAQLLVEVERRGLLR